MAVGKKITGADIFDLGSLKKAYADFIEENSKAKKAVLSLKSELMKASSAVSGGGFTKLSLEIRKLRVEILKVASSIDKMNTKQNKLNTSQKKTAKSVKDLTNNYKKLAVQQKKTTTGFGLMTKSAGGFQSVLAALGIVGVIDSVIRLGQATYETAKELDTVNLTLGKVTDSSYEFGRAQEFLVDISEKFGLNLLKTSSKFSTFRASAKESNFTLKQTMEIFETFSNAGKSLGKSGADLDRIFLALEQMMSKGRVSSEELRRQLGEVLPGAVSIMAKSMGVGTRELERMLKAGEVLAADVLPGFSEEVKKTFSIDNSERIEIMATQQERLTTSWIKFVDQITQDEGILKNFIDGTLKSLTDAMIKLTSIFAAFGSENKQGLIADLSKDFSNLLNDAKQLFGFLQKISQFVPSTALVNWLRGSIIESAELTNAIDDNINSMEHHKQTVEEVTATYKEYLKTTGEKEQKGKVAGYAYMSQTDLDAEYDRLKDLTAKYLKAQKIIAAAAEKAKKTAGENRDVAAAAITPEMITDLEDSADIYRRAMYDLVNDIDKYWDFAETSSSEAEKKMWLDKIAIAKEGITEYQSIIAQVTGSGLADTGTTGFKAVSVDEMLNTQQGLENKNSSSDTSEVNPIAKLLGLDDDGLSKLQKQVTAGLNVAAEFNDAIGELLDAQFAKKEQQLDLEEEQINEFYDTKMKLAEDDADLQDKIGIRRAAAEAKLETKRKKLEYDKAKQKKQQSIIDAVINTALGVTAALTAGPILGIVLAAITAAAGAVQIAAISSSPLPKYALGTDNHPGGGAILGDGGKQELAISPDGTAYLSGSSSEIVNMSKGTKVIPDAKEFIQHQVVRSVLAIESLRNEQLVDQITGAVVKGFKDAKINSKTNVTVNSSIDHALWRGNLLNGDS